MLHLTGHSGQVTALAFSADGRWLATAGWDGSARLWERPNYVQRRLLRTSYDHALAVAFATDSSHVMSQFRNRNFSRDYRDFGTLAWTTTVPQSWAAADYLPPEDTWFTGGDSVALCPFSHMFAVVCESTVEIWDADRRARVRTYPFSAEKGAGPVTYSHDGQRLALFVRNDDRRGVVYLWSKGKARPDLLHIRDDRVETLAFNRDSSQLFGGFKNGRLVWWQLQVEWPPQTDQPSGSAVVDMAFSPEGNSLLLACEDGQIRLWDVESRQVRAAYDWQIGTIRCVAFAPDGLTAAAGGDGVVLVWDVDE